MISKLNPVESGAHYQPLLQELLNLCTEICRALRDLPQDDVPKRLILAFATKATQTLKAIIILYENDLPQEAQSLVRISFELNITFQAFLVLLRADSRHACERVLDSVMLDKVKQQRSCDFRGLEMVPRGPTREDFDRIERTISSRYSDSDLKKIRKHGFSGMSVEERAANAGCKDLYNVVYRNFSRNVHSSDLTELLLTIDPSLSPDHRADYHDSRESIGREVALISASAIADGANRLFGLGVCDRLRDLAVQYRQIKAARAKT